MNRIVIFGAICLYSCCAFGTGQTPDSVRFEGETYSLIGLQGELPTPQSFGMQTEASSSGNWRGYFSEYAVVDGVLTLVKITVNARNQEYSSINGVSPDMEAARECFDYRDGETVCSSDGGVYDGIDLTVPFTGKMRLGGELILSFYVHMGFQKPSAFRRVYDLRFVEGRLVGVEDRSTDVEEIRGQFQRLYESLPTEEAVDRAFSLGIEPLQ